MKTKRMTMARIDELSKLNIPEVNECIAEMHRLIRDRYIVETDRFKSMLVKQSLKDRTEVLRLKRYIAMHK